LRGSSSIGGITLSICLLLLAPIALASSAHSHGGGLDRYGCHTNRKTGAYHCHRGSGPPTFKATPSLPKASKPRAAAAPLPLVGTSQAVRLPKSTKVEDGDTIRPTRKGPLVRLVGCDTPELRDYKCEAERALAKRAKSRLQQLMRSGQLTLQLVNCSCRPGTLGTKKCNRGRLCGIVQLGEGNVCDLFINEGLAHPFACGPKSCPPQESWCEGKDVAAPETLY